ncbi:MAG: hypothetical protein E7352_03840 [Clostridiales bacterium]|nr:hypothetical protein [Clostridiales bacterium]
MKKKLFAAFAATLACATLALGACSANEAPITFVNYWDLNTEYTNEDPTHESLVYDVSFTPSYSSFVNYKIDYDGTYKTTLDWEKDDKTYTSTSSLQLAVTFEVNGDKETRNDFVTTTVKFHQAGGVNNLRPISSSKTILSHTPITNSGAFKASDCYSVFCYKIETVYENGFGYCTMTEYDVDTTSHLPDYDKVLEEKKFVFGAYSSKCSVLDNEQFPIAFRAMPAGTNAAVQIFNPFAGYSQKYSVALSAAPTKGSYKYKLNGEETERTIDYHTASIVVDGESSGLPQTAEIATLNWKDTTLNINRNVMLRYYTPLAYNMGTIVYSLSSVTNA